MAFINQDQNNPELQQPGQANAPMNQVPTSSTGTGATVSNTSGGPQGATSIPASTQTPPVQDLQAYLTANQPQAVQMGQNIATGLNNQANTVTGDINSAQQNVSGQAQRYDQAPDSALVARAAADPKAFTGNPTDVQAFKAQRDANYAGPTSFESTPFNQTLTNEVQNAQQNAPDVNRPGGVEQLVRGQEQNPTLGMANLDTLLLQENPGAMSPIQNALPQFAKLGDYLGSARGTSNAAIQKAIADDQASKAGVQNTFFSGPNAVVPTWQNELNQRVATADQQYATAADDFNHIAQGINANNLTGLEPSQMTRLGLTPTLAQSLNNSYQQDLPLRNAPFNSQVPDYSHFYTAGILPQSAPTLANTATGADYAKDSALGDLLGTGYTPYLDYTQAGQAGTAQTPQNPIFNSADAGSQWYNIWWNDVGKFL